MIKSISLIKRKPGMSREEFMRYYEEVHAPQALRIFGMNQADFMDVDKLVYFQVEERVSE